MSAKYTRLGQLKGKSGVPAREYFTARDFVIFEIPRPQGLDNYC